MMARGKVEMLPCDCAYCGTALPLTRHPSTRYCTAICRGNARYQRDHIGGREIIKCLDCGKGFIKVGAHVVQKHGYADAREYRIEHGLDYKRGIVTAEHRALLANNVVESGTIHNLEKGAKYRFKHGGRSSEIVKRYWEYRKTGILDE